MKLQGEGKLREGRRAPLFIVTHCLNRLVLLRTTLNAPRINMRDICCRGPLGGYGQPEFAEAGDAARRIRSEAGRAVAVQFACIEESPGSAEQDAG